MSFLFNPEVRFNEQNPILSPLGEFRVSQINVIFDDKSQVNEALLWSGTTTGGGTIDTSNSLNDTTIRLTVPTTSGASVIRQSNASFPYQPGKSTFCTFTGKFELKNNVKSRLGYFNIRDGVFFEADDLGMFLVVRSNVTGTPIDTRIPQSQWNLDRFDGTGPSGITMDWNRNQFFILNFLWQGSGFVRWGFNVDGFVRWAHIMYSANVMDSPFMGNPHLPSRWEITNKATTASSTTLRQTCTSIAIQGTVDLDGLQFAAINPSTKTVGTNTPLLSLRINPTYRNSTFVFDRIELINTANNAFGRYEIFYGGTVTGGTWNNLGAISQVNYDLTSFSGGTRIGAGVFAGRAEFAGSLENQKIYAGFDLTPNPIPITIICNNYTGTSTVAGAVSITEFS